jgi:hypothetical protein
VTIVNSSYDAIFLTKKIGMFGWHEMKYDAVSGLKPILLEVF